MGILVSCAGADSCWMDKAIYHCQSLDSLKAPPSLKRNPCFDRLARGTGTAEAGAGAVGGLQAYKILTSAGPLTFRCKTLRRVQPGLMPGRRAVCSGPPASPLAAKI